MRPSVARLSEMPGPKVYNLWWGDKTGQRQRGMVSYTISPFQSKAAPNMFQNYLFNGYRRLAIQTPYFVLPFVAGYGLYSWAKGYDEWQNSKAGHLAGAGGH